MKHNHIRVDDPGVFQEILDKVGAYVYIKDLQGRYQYVNQKVCELFDLDLREIEGKDDSAFFSFEHSDELRRNDMAVMEEGNTVEREERNIIRTTGEERFYWVIKHPMRGEQGQIIGMYGISIDITEIVQLRKELELLTQTDELTQLYNRRHFLRMAGHALAMAGRYNTPCSIISFDLDHFKRINDTYGHHAGDEVLRKVAATCRDLVREPDIIGRLGGEEFSVLLPQTALDGARNLAERLRRAVSGLEIEGDWNGTITPAISAGVATMQPDDDVDRLLVRADDKLYEAKNHGRNRVCG